MSQPLSPTPDAGALQPEAVGASSPRPIKQRREYRT